LTNTILVAAHLDSAVLIGANLEGAILIGARLAGANLTGATLTNAEIADEQLSTASMCWGATLRDGHMYDGRFNLESDLAYARDLGVNVESPDELARFYSAGADF
jgi:uncharacterized protein YjbI with pentapeptide repeats